MKLRIGTDCSGIEAPIQALKQLNINFEHKWACEIDNFARKSLEANYEPEKMYTDMTKRKHALLPDIDMYVCGFPCTPFSLMGMQKGSEDRRSNIMLHCVKVIQTKTPKIFILENVKNFKFIEKGVSFAHLLKLLNETGEYNIYTDILNTRDYGLPQNRERLYIVGIKKDFQKAEYTCPQKCVMTPLDDLVLDRTIYQVKTTCKITSKNLAKLNSAETNIVTPCNFFYPLKSVSPTLTTNCGRFYLNKYNRTILPQEALLLQGFPKDFVQVVSNTQLFKQAGNSMSVCVLKAIINKIKTVTLWESLI